MPARRSVALPQLLLTKVVDDVDGPVLLGPRAGAHGDGVGPMMTVVQDGPFAQGNRRFETESLVRHGEPAAVLERTAEEETAGRIVVGSRGRGPWRSAVLGSVSGRLVEIARRPVIIVPPRDDRDNAWSGFSRLSARVRRTVSSLVGDRFVDPEKGPVTPSSPPRPDR